MHEVAADAAAVGAAACFAVATALQHRAAATGARIEGSPSASSRALVHILRRPLWLGGLLADAAGLALHILALAWGRLLVVQILLVCALLFALPLASVLEHRRIGSRDLRWSAVVVLGCAGFLAVGSPTGGVDQPELGPAAAASGGFVALAGLAWLKGRSNEGARAPVLLGFATGLLFALTAGLIKAVTGQVIHDVDHVLVTWPLYVLLVVGPAGIVLNQLAYQAGPLSASLPMITIMDPVGSLILAVALYDEQLPGSLPRLTVALLALAVLLVGVGRLAAVEGQDDVS